MGTTFDRAQKSASRAARDWYSPHFYLDRSAHTSLGAIPIFASLRFGPPGSGLWMNLERSLDGTCGRCGGFHFWCASWNLLCGSLCFYGGRFLGMWTAGGWLDHGAGFPRICWVLGDLLVVFALLPLVEECYNCRLLCRLSV